ncbi:hypothetical protein PVAND_012064 [Polypedilum vanderplanki]|uniref:Uncharacterized protein n=1 Tax=Polypedilum vanderplanki TaxID=319348 RepID=A0A9J6CM71_POLVA|nr:hypothetical protein PVAND_012064 [Polypedilum vanderplanki]
MALKFFKWSINARFYSNTVNSNLVEKLSKISAAKYLDNIEELLNTAPDLCRYSPEQWEKSLENLKELGFNPNKFQYMIAQSPSLLSKPKEKIEDAMNNWSFFDFGRKETYQLIERYPEFLDVKNFNLIHENLSIVKSFVGQKHGFKVIRNSPNIISDSSKSLEEKVAYLRDIMKVDPVEVYKSDVFSLDLLSLKTRHVFLERLGMWFKKKKKGDENDAHEAKKNPKLSKISDSTDKRFATKVCHVTLEEYETFVEMYKEEIENDEDAVERRKRMKNSNEYIEEFEDDENDRSHIYYNK